MTEIPLSENATIVNVQVSGDNNLRRPPKYEASSANQAWQKFRFLRRRRLSRNTTGTFEVHFAPAKPAPAPAPVLVIKNRNKTGTFWGFSKKKIDFAGTKPELFSGKWVHPEQNQDLLCHF